MASELIPADYGNWLAEVKVRVHAARSRAALSVNAELIRLYHSIGVGLLERQRQSGWGTKVIERVAADLRFAFPDMKGFSASNLKYMRFFGEHCPELRFGQQAADQLPWFHVVTLLTQAQPTDREWYATQASRKGGRAKRWRGTSRTGSKNGRERR